MRALPNVVCPRPASACRPWHVDALIRRSVAGRWGDAVADSVRLVCGAGDLHTVDSGEHTDRDMIAGGPFVLVWRNRPIGVNVPWQGADIAGEAGVARGTGGVHGALIARKGAARQRVSVVRLLVVRLLELVERCSRRWCAVAGETLRMINVVASRIASHTKLPGAERT